MATFQAGRLRHKVSLQDYVERVDPSTGAREKGWVEVAKVWAEIAPLSARDFIQSAALQSQVTTRITIRHRNGVTPSMRIIHRDKVYSITGVLADKESGLEYLTLPCTEGANEG